MQFKYNEKASANILNCRPMEIFAWWILHFYCKQREFYYLPSTFHNFYDKIAVFMFILHPSAFEKVFVDPRNSLRFLSDHLDVNKKNIATGKVKNSSVLQLTTLINEIYDWANKMLQFFTSKTFWLIPSDTKSTKNTRKIEKQ